MPPTRTASGGRWDFPFCFGALRYQIKGVQMIQKLSFLLCAALAVFVSPGCQPAPIECVCKCDGPPPPGTEVTVVEASAEAAPKAVVMTPPKKAAAPAARPATAARPTPPAALARAAARKNAPRRASGRVAHEPGSGTPTTLTDGDKKEMVTVMTEFANAAGARNLAGMQKWTTVRLGKSLESAVEKYTDRLFRRTDMFSTGAQKGVSVLSANDLSDGNFDVEFKFGSGETARCLLFREEGKWRLNRL